MQLAPETSGGFHRGNEGFVIKAGTATLGKVKSYWHPAYDNYPLIFFSQP